MLNIKSFKEFKEEVVKESLHPELQQIFDTNVRHRYSKILKKIKELNQKGLPTGLEGSKPKGSSRVYLFHQEPEDVVLDGVPTKIKAGTKIAIKASLDNFHKTHLWGDLSLGQMQNSHELDGINHNFRVIRQRQVGEGYETNPSGILPPVFDHDQKRHDWQIVGHARDLRPGEFEALTVAPGFKKGISFRRFNLAIQRNHHQNNGRYWQHGGIMGSYYEKILDNISNHPFVSEVINYHNLHGSNPSDLSQKKNLGVFEHPDGRKFLVIRDHGFGAEVEKAYADARRGFWRR